MRGVVFLCCFIADAIQVDVDAEGLSRQQHARGIEDAESIAIALKALRAKPNDSEVQRFNLGKLKNLAVDEDNLRPIAVAGGIEVVLEALRMHAQDLQVQRVGLSVLGDLAFDDDNERSIVAAGGIDVVLEVLRTHAQEDPEVEREGLRALGNLGYREPAGDRV